MSYISKADTDFVHLALATYPKHGNVENYVSEVRSQFYQEFSKQLGNYYASDDEVPTDSIIYEPLAYHLFGQYDIAFISLINNAKFGQKAFWSPKFSDLHSNSFQVFTGICPDLSSDGQFVLRETFQKISKQNYDFVAICNLKLSNGLLIGNGQDFLDAVMITVKEEVSKHIGCEFLIIQSFSWFEINLIIFDKSPKNLIEIISSLRSLRSKDLKFSNSSTVNAAGVNETGCDRLIRNSLYYARVSEALASDGEMKQQLIQNTHVFADTHSYIGVRLSAMSDAEYDFSDIVFNTQTEFRTKPGHSSMMISELKSVGIFNLESSAALTGKSDYQLFEKDPALFSNNHKLFHAYYGAQRVALRRHIRNFKTRPYFNLSRHEEYSLKDEFLSELPNDLSALTFSPVQLSEIHKMLKAIKVSRQIREKVLKIYSNYNLSIIDSVIYTYFVDFVLFMKRLTELIKYEYDFFIQARSSKADHEFPKSVDELENILRHYIDSFDEAYRVRMMNCYEFEDIYDFELDFNSSTQQLLSSYNMVAQKISELFFKQAKGHIIRLHSQNTIGNDISINCSINHLTSPEFIFFTLSKEILNSTTSIGGDGQHLYLEIERHLSLLSNKFPEISELKADGVLDMNYLIIDVYRLIYSCNYEIDVLGHWIWAFCLQNSALYNSKGLMDEIAFRAKLVQILCIYRLMGDNKSPRCPIPELYNFWSRYFQPYSAIIDHVFEDGVIAELFKLHLMKSATPDSIQFESSKRGLLVSNARALNVSIRDIEGGLSILSGTKMFKLDFKDNQFLGTTLVNIFFHRQREAVFGQLIALIGDKLARGIPVLLDTEKFENREIAINETLFLAVLMNAYLYKIYDLNSKKNILLRRSFETGLPDPDFIKKGDNSGIYQLDSFGGIFFTTQEGRNEYYRMRNALLQSIWHFSTVVKKKFILEQIMF